MGWVGEVRAEVERVVARVEAAAAAAAKAAEGGEVEATEAAAGSACEACADDCETGVERATLSRCT